MCGLHKKRGNLVRGRDKIMDESAVIINNLSKEIKRNSILKDINLDVQEGEICGIIGRNGSGKSMLFKCICGLVNATSGSVKVFGENVGNGKLPHDIGVIIEHPGFILNYSAFKNLKYLAAIRNIIHDDDIIDAINKIGLDPNSKKRVQKYSLGMKQRLGIAQAIMEKPRLLILDEPMNGLDKEGVNLIRDLLIDMKKSGVTILMASHNAEDIRILCDKVYEIDKGEIVLN